MTTNTSKGMGSEYLYSYDLNEQQEILLMDLVEKMQLASSIDQSTLSIALSNLTQFLRGCQNQNHDQQQKRQKDIKELVDDDNNNINNNNNNNNVNNNNSKIKNDFDMLRFVVSSLLNLEIVHVGSALFSKTQQYIQYQIDECLDLCGLRTSFLLALENINMSTSTTSIRSMNMNMDMTNSNPNSKDFSITNNEFQSQSCIIASSRVLRRSLLQWQKCYGHGTATTATTICQGSESDRDEDEIEIDHLNKSLNENENENICQTFFRDYFIYYQQQQQQYQQNSINNNNYNNYNKKLLEKQIINFINSILIVLPTQIANTYHLYKLKLPIWAKRSNMFMNLVESSAHIAFHSLCHYYESATATTTTKNKTRNTSGAEGIHTNYNNSYSLMMQCFDNKKVQYEIEILFFTKLIEILLRHGNADDVSDGIYNFRQVVLSKLSSLHVDDDTKMNVNTKHHHLEIMKYLLRSSTTQLSSPRSCAILIRSFIRKIISEIEIYPTNSSSSSSNKKNSMNSIKEWNRICKEQCMPFLRHVALDMLISDESNCDMFVNLLILSPSPTGDPVEQRLMTRCVVELLTCIPNNCDDDNDDDNKGPLNDSTQNNDNNKEREVKFELMKHLNTVVNVWNDPLFINETDHFQQNHISSFLLAATDYMHKDIDNVKQETVIQGLVLGVTNRLKVSESLIRLDGMMVAEKLAPLLGETLRFDELDGIRDEDIIPGKKSVDYDEKNPSLEHTVKEKRKVTKKKKKKATMEIDPDEEYLSDEMSLSNNEDGSTESSDNYDSSDSEWGESEIIECDLSDDEEDLRPVPKPVYLHECLDLLRSREDDNEARYMQEVALEEVSTLIRVTPPDLSHMATLLTKELLYIENKYNLTSFTQLRWEGLCSLAVCAPLNTIPCLQQELFNDVALEVRLDIFEVMKYSSWELCGQIELDKRRNNR
jgi:hypothetical protein